MTKDEKLYLDERFDRVHEKLDDIKEQTTRTNGRVSQLEKNEISHLITCPQGPKIDAICNDLNEYRFFKKYPKVLAAVIFCIIISFGAGIWNSYSKINKTTQVNKELIQQVDSLMKTIQ